MGWFRHSNNDDETPLNTLLSDDDGDLYTYNGHNWSVNGQRVDDAPVSHGKLKPATEEEVKNSRWFRS